MNDFELLRVFIAIVESGSASKAADNLDVAVSAVSRRLKELETSLGTQLIQRTTRSMHLTESGKRFYQRALHILASLEEAKDEVKRQGQGLSGGMKIACPVSFGVAHVVPTVAEFMLKHTDVHIDLDMNDKRLDLIESGLDIAIRIGPLQDSSYKAKKLAHFHHVVCASPAFFAAHGKPQTPQALQKLPGLCYSNLQQTGVWQYKTPDGAKGKVNIQSKLNISNGDALRECAVAGLGVLCEPSFIVHDAIRRGALETALTDHIWYGMDIYAVYPDTKFVPARVRAFIDHLAAHFGEQPYWEANLF